MTKVGPFASVIRHGICPAAIHKPHPRWDMVHEVVDVAHATLACDAETTDAPAYKVRVFDQG